MIRVSLGVLVRTSIVLIAALAASAPSVERTLSGLDAQVEAGTGSASYAQGYTCGYRHAHAFVVRSGEPPRSANAPELVLDDAGCAWTLDPSGFRAASSSLERVVSAHDRANERLRFSALAARAPPRRG